MSYEILKICLTFTTGGALIFDDNQCSSTLTLNAKNILLTEGGLLQVHTLLFYFLYN